MPMTASEVLRLVAKTQFKDFTKDDHSMFNGTTSNDPLIGEPDDTRILVLDGDIVSVTNTESDTENVYTFRIVDMI